MADTIPGCVFDTVKRHTDHTCLLYKRGGQYQAISYRDLAAEVDRVSAGLEKLGLRKGDRVGIFSYNRPEWIIADLAVLRQGGIVVPIYHTLPGPGVHFIIRDSGLKILFVENMKLFSVVEAIRSETPTLQTIILFEHAEESKGAGLTSFAELGRGVQAGARPAPDMSKSDLATIVYTSGTTAEPKGVMLTHGNIVSNAKNAARLSRTSPDDVYLSFLPLCHMFERTCGHYALLFAGGTIAYAESVATVARNAEEVRPTIVCVVPRVIEKAYNEARRQIECGSWLQRALVKAAVRDLNEYANRRYKHIRIPPWLWLKCRLHNAVVAPEFRKLGGGRLRLVVSGGAPLDREIAKILFIFGFTIVEGYGLTETSPVVCSNTPEENRLGTVGKPLDQVEVKIGENDEILVCGPNVMRGYFNRPVDTARAIDERGWFHTGDQGRFDEHGNLVITGRIKEVLVTSYGKKISAALVETALARSRFVEQAVLCGDKREYLVALLVPSRRCLQEYAQSRGLFCADFGALLGTAEVQELFERELDEATKELARHEKPKAFALLDDPFTVENGLMTPTLKLRKGAIMERYRNLIAGMYSRSEAH